MISLLAFGFMWSSILTIQITDRQVAEMYYIVWNLPIEHFPLHFIEWCPKDAQKKLKTINRIEWTFSTPFSLLSQVAGLPITAPSHLLGLIKFFYQEDCTFWDSTTYILKDKGFDRKDGGSLKCACLRLCHRQIWQKLWHFTAIIWCNQIFQYHYPRRHLDWHSSTHRFIYDRMRLTYPLPSSIAVPSYEIAPYWHFHCHRLRGAIISNCSIYSSAVWRTSSSDPAVSKAPSCTTIQLTSTFLWFYNIFEGGGDVWRIHYQSQIVITFWWAAIHLTFACEKLIFSIAEDSVAI